MSLDLDANDLEIVLNLVIKTINDYLRIDSRPVVNNEQTGLSSFEPFPEEGLGISEAVKLANSSIMASSVRSIDPRFMAYISGGGNHASMVGEFLSAAMNQNCAKWHISRSHPIIEKQVILWLAELMGLASPNIEGILVAGGSIANLMALDVALSSKVKNIKFDGLYNHKQLVVYCSAEAHVCIDKAVETLGLGTKNLRKVETDVLGRIEISNLDRLIQRDLKNGLQPFCVIGTAGTVNSGAVDPLEDLAEIAKIYGLWFHVDSAYGGPAAGLNELSSLFAGLSLADSVAVDPHKWLYQQFGCGCLLLKDGKQLKKRYSKSPDYLEDNNTFTSNIDFYEYGIELSRPFRALKIWFSIKAFGKNRILNEIRSNIRLCSYLFNKLSEKPNIEVFSQPSLSILCFRILPLNSQNSDQLLIDGANSQLVKEIESEGLYFISSTRIKGKFYLRTCFVNHRLSISDVDFFISYIQQKALSVF